jgi:hypothetical protein
LRGMSEEASDELIGEFAKGEVDLRFKKGKGGRVAAELLSPERLLGGEVSADLFDRLVGRGDLRSFLGIESNAHAWSSFTVTALLDVYNSDSGSNRHPFLGMDPNLSLSDFLSRPTRHKE